MFLSHPVPIGSSNVGHVSDGGEPNDLRKTYVTITCDVAGVVYISPVVRVSSLYRLALYVVLHSFQRTFVFILDA